MITGVLFFAGIAIVFGWLFPPRGGWLDYIKSCPLWHEPEE